MDDDVVVVDRSLIPWKTLLSTEIEKEGEGIQNEQFEPVEPKACTLPVEEKAWKKYHSSKGKVVCAFDLKIEVDEEIFKTVQYIFTNSLQKKEILFSNDITKLSRSQLSLFRPDTEIDGNLLTSKERIGDGTYWFLPTTVSQQQLGKMLMKNVANYEQWRERHFSGDLKVCEHDGPAGHWFLADIDMKVRHVYIWDSMVNPIDKRRRTILTRKMFFLVMQLASLERVLEVDLNIAFGGEVILSEFGVSHTEKSLKQGNGSECGIYIMKHMQHLSKKTTSPVEKFDSHTARMELALEIVLNESNDIQEEVKSKVQAFYHEYTDSNPKGSTKGTPIKLAFVRSPIKSPKDQRYSTKKQKAKNMTPNCPARRTRGAIKQ